MINVYDNFFSEEDYNFIWEYCRNASYFYGEGYPEELSCGEITIPQDVTGLTHEIYYHTDDVFNPDSTKSSLKEKTYQSNNGNPDEFINQRKMLDLFANSIEKKFPEYNLKNMTRLYINCFASSERSHFHLDGKVGTTFLYYANDYLNLNDGGETQFIVDNNIFGVPPVRNRLVSFDANILHTATPFRDQHRFTVAIKYGIIYD